MQQTKVVNLRRTREPYVYIGRGSKWGNPFVIGRDGDRAEVIRLYREYLLSRPDLLAEVRSLKGKTLGCYCKPEACHGDLLALLADKL